MGHGIECGLEFSFGYGCLDERELQKETRNKPVYTRTMAHSQHKHGGWTLSQLFHFSALYVFVFSI